MASDLPFPFLTGPRRALLVFVAALLLAPGAAYAGCEKDTDCKGDRICKRGECTDPDPDPDVGWAGEKSTRGADSRDVRYAEKTIGESYGFAGVGWGLGSTGIAAGIAAVALGIADEDGWQGPAAGGIALLGVGVPMAAGSGARARAGLGWTDWAGGRPRRAPGQPLGSSTAPA